MPEILRDIISIYENNKLSKLNVQGEDITDFYRVKNKLVLKLINLERNKEFLADVPYVVFNDLAIVFYVILATEEDGMSSITVRNNLMNIWGIDVIVPSGRVTVDA